MLWTKGRQGTGYEKLKLFQFLNMDCYILRYKVGDSIPWHTDPVAGRKHWRLNITLKKAKLGGELLLPRYHGMRIGSRCILFRPDLFRHSVTKVKEGSRYVLTFGIAI